MLQSKDTDRKRRRKEGVYIIYMEKREGERDIQTYRDELLDHLR
jgi:hypothetical protein